MSDSIRSLGSRILNELIIPGKVTISYLCQELNITETKLPSIVMGNIPEDLVVKITNIIDGGESSDVKLDKAKKVIYNLIVNNQKKWEEGDLTFFQEQFSFADPELSDWVNVTGNGNVVHECMINAREHYEFKDEN